jgi:hypothetical protein
MVRRVCSKTRLFYIAACFMTQADKPVTDAQQIWEIHRPPLIWVPGRGAEKIPGAGKTATPGYTQTG